MKRCLWTREQLPNIRGERGNKETMKGMIKKIEIATIRKIPAVVSTTPTLGGKFREDDSHMKIMAKQDS
jgi:hypothetical protein